VTDTMPVLSAEYELSPWERMNPLPAAWKALNSTFPSSCGKVELFERVYSREAPGKPTALFVLHGFGEHGGRYCHFLPFIQEKVGMFSTYDHRGHGRSGGRRGHLHTFDDFVGDARAALQRLENRLRDHTGEPEIHLLGHSMGGLIALSLIMKYRDLPVNSVTLSAPLLGIALRVPLLKKTAALILAKILGSLSMSAGLDITKLSHDRKVEEALRADRLSHGKMTPALFTEILRAIRRAHEFRGSIPYPVLFLVPLEDYVVDAVSTQRFFTTFPCHDKKLITYEHSYHEIFNEGGGLFSKNEAFNDLQNWMESHGTA